MEPFLFAKEYSTNPTRPTRKKSNDVPGTAIIWVHGKAFCINVMTAVIAK